MAVTTGEEVISYDAIGVITTGIFAGEEVESYDAIGVNATTTLQKEERKVYAVASLSLASQQYVVNKAWDAVAGDWVSWETEQIDFSGSEYPGPGVFGTDTTDYRVESVMFTRT